MAINLWDRKKSFAYIKFGSFFLIAFGLFFITLLSMREVNIFKGHYTIVIKFDFSEGLRPSSPIRFCGVDVGEVKKVTIKEENNKPKVYVLSKIDKGVKIPKSSSFFINSLSLFGEKYLEINPPEEAKAYINEGDVLEGISPVPLFGLFATFNQTMREIERFVKEGKVKTSFENILDNVEGISIDIKGLISDMRNNQGTIGRLINDDSLYQTTEEFLTDLKENPWKLLHKPKKKN